MSMKPCKYSLKKLHAIINFRLQYVATLFIEIVSGLLVE